MATSSTSSDRATYRTVVLLRRSEKLKLERLASREKVSSAEVIRRFIRSGEEMLELQKDEEIISAAMKIIAAAVSEANQSLCRTIDRIDQLHLELHKRDIP
jgi:dephospho-CoA kinase